MGSIILCRNIKAKHPYEISRIHKKLYTIEEVCYYLIHNIYLIDSTIMNEQFCGWLGEELELEELEYLLKDALLEHCSREQFISIILSSSNMFTINELNYMEETLEHIKDQKEVEQR